MFWRGGEAVEGQLKRATGVVCETWNVRGGTDFANEVLLGAGTRDEAKRARIVTRPEEGGQEEKERRQSLGWDGLITNDHAATVAARGGRRRRDRRPASPVDDEGGGCKTVGASSEMRVPAARWAGLGLSGWRAPHQDIGHHTTPPPPTRAPLYLYLSRALGRPSLPAGLGCARVVVARFSSFCTGRR